MEARGRRVLWSERLEDPAAPPFFSWVLAIRSCLAGYDDDSLIEDLGTGAADVANLIPELRDRLDLPARRVTRDSVTARYQMLDSVARFLLTSSRRSPLVLLFDNLHLADRSSLELLEYFVQQITGYPVLIIAAYRSFELDPSGDGELLKSSLQRLSLSARFSQARLDGLERNEVADLLKAHTDVSMPASLVDAVYQQSDGNPLFVVEVAKMLQRRSAELPLPGVGFHFDPPESLRDVILARLAILPAQTCALLRQASVLGRNFDINSWRALAGYADEQMLAITQSAEDAGIVQVIRPGHYRFQHALYREVLYGQLSRTERSDLHLAAATHFEQLRAGDAESVTAPLAYHYFEVASSGYSKKAVQFNREAAEYARGQRAYSESAKFLEQALLAFELNPGTNFQNKFSLLLALGSALFRAGQQTAALDPLLRASKLARKAHDWHALAEALLEFQFVCGQLGVAHSASLPLHLALLQNLPENLQTVRTRVLASLADAQRLVGNNDLAVATARESMELARELADPALRLDCFCRGSWALGCSSANPETLEYRQTLATEIREIATAQGSAEEVLMVMSTISFNLCSRSTAEELNAHLVACRRLMRSEYHPHYLNILAGFEISVNILQGKWDDAMRGAVALRQRAYVQDAAGLEGGFGQQMFVIQRARGQLVGAAALIKRMEADIDPEKLWLPGQILLHCELQNWHRARELLNYLGDLSLLNHDGMYLASLVYLSEACIALNDRQRLIELYKYLKPFRFVVACIPGTVLMGAASGYLASVAAQLGKNIRAPELFAEAIELNSKMDAMPWLARVQTDYAQFLLRSQKSEDQARARELLISAKQIATKFALQPLLTRLEELESGSAIGHLTRREHSVLVLIAGGLSNKQIASELSVSLSTVATHVRNILRKLHVTNRTEATDFARRSAWLD